MSNNQKRCAGPIFLKVILIIATAALLWYLIVPHTRLFYSKNPFLPSFLQLNHTDVVLKVGEEVKLYVFGLNKRVTFQSTDIKVATVNINGKITAYRRGTTFIKATCNGKRLKCRVRVIDLNKKKLKLRVNQSYSLKVRNAHLGVSWTSSNTDVVTISRFGRVRGISKGNATITARYKRKILKCTVVVK